MGQWDSVGQPISGIRVGGDGCPRRGACRGIVGQWDGGTTYVGEAARLGVEGYFGDVYSHQRTAFTRGSKGGPFMVWLTSGEDDYFFLRLP